MADMVDVYLKVDEIGTLFVTLMEGNRDIGGLYDGADFFPLTDRERKYMRMGCRVLKAVDAGRLAELVKRLAGEE